VNLDELKQLFELIAERNITEFELEEEGVKLRIKKDGGNVRITDVAVAAAIASPADAPAPSTPSSPGENNGHDVSDALDGLAIVEAPMVGTFYRQPEPGADPFAGKGQQVKKGQILCIIEAMKLMNEIESELSGEVVEVFVEDGQSVQYGDRLFAIREI
jgi:acetyl-CoA carboxylase biotin carboxyl carrier protein